MTESRDQPTSPDRGGPGLGELQREEPSELVLFRRGERVHAKHPEVAGALCQVCAWPGPLVTRDLEWVTCKNCLRELARDIEIIGAAFTISAQMRERLQAMGKTAPSRRPSRSHVRHVLSPRWAAYGRTECGTAGAKLVSVAPEEATCRTCRAVMAKRKREVARG